MSAAGGLYDNSGAENAPTAEEFSIAVEARDVLEADREAWATLEKYLGVDPVHAWRLSEMKHAQHPEKPGMIVSLATFVRNQDVPVPPPIQAVTVEDEA